MVQHLEYKCVDNWVLACRNVEVAEMRCRGKKTWRECVNGLKWRMA